MRPTGMKGRVEINHAYVHAYVPAHVPFNCVCRLQDLTKLRPLDRTLLKAKVNNGCAKMTEKFKTRDPCKDISHGENGKKERKK